MDGTPPPLPSDLEDVAWALQTAEALWKRGERVDAVVWVRRAAQAAGEGDDAKRAVTLASCAAELSDWIGSHTITGDGLSPSDVEVVSSSDFEAGFLVDSEGDAFPDDDATPILSRPRLAMPHVAPALSAAQAHAPMLDPWAHADLGAERTPSEVPMRRFEDDEVATSARTSAVEVPPTDDASDPIPRPPVAPRFPLPKGRSAVPDGALARGASRSPPEEADTTTYRQINMRSSRPEFVRPPPAVARFDSPPAPPRQAPRGPLGRPPLPARPAGHRAEPEAPTKSRAAALAPSAPSRVESEPPALDLLEMVDSIIPSEGELGLRAVEFAREAPVADRSPPALTARPLAAPTQRPPAGSEGTLSISGPPTAPPPTSSAVKPSGPPTRRLGHTLLDLATIEALTDLPDDAREAFAVAATMHTIQTNEEVSSFALALIVDGEIDVSATIVDAPALRLERNAILRSRGSIVPGIPLRLVCASAKALLATWDGAAVEAAFRTCPWVEDELRVLADRVQARAGVTMGPLGERFDQSLRDHLLNKLTMRTLAVGEVIIEQGKPTPIVLVGIGELVLKKNDELGDTLGPGDFVFPSQVLNHAPAPASAAAGAGGAVVLFGDRAVAQELLMSFPPLLEVLATI